MHPAWGHYPDTLLRFPGAGLTIDLRRQVPSEAIHRLAGLGLAAPFAVVTACNPRGQPLDDGANRRLSAVLTATVMDRYPAACLAHGVSADGAHEEPGWAIPAPLEEVRPLAVRFLQLAVFWFDGARFSIVPVLSDQPPLILPARSPES